MVFKTQENFYRFKEHLEITAKTNISILEVVGRVSVYEAQIRKYSILNVNRSQIIKRNFNKKLNKTC